MTDNLSDLIDGTKYIWKLPDIEKEAVIDLSQKYNLSHAIVQALLNRGYKSQEDFDDYLFSLFEKSVAHASLLKDAQKAVERLIFAIKNKEKILICGDYDVDGITSSAMMMICLLPLGAKVNYFLPHRVKDGYGLSEKIVKRASENGYKVLITVDNGISAFEAAKEAKNVGIDLIITDHHKPHKELPEAFAIVNPHQEDCNYPYKKLAGVGVIFKVLSLLYENLHKELPTKVYELLMLGTIADVVPLTGENRFWVRHGLRLINSQESLSLKILKQNARLCKPQLTSLDIGFFFAPQINALGRLEDARQGVRFLVGTNFDEVKQVGTILYELNESRKAIEKSVFDDIAQQIEKKEIDLERERIILASSKEWPPGVIGLVASRIVAAYNRPALLFHISKNGIAKGSCRSIPDFNMFAALQEQQDILLSFGGHAMAAGLSLPTKKLNQLKKRLEKLIAIQIPILQIKPAIKIDAELSLTEVNKKLINDLEYMQPFGNENSQPVFYVKNLTIVDEPRLLKEAHTKLMIFNEGIIKPVIFFNRPDIYNTVIAKRDAQLSLAAYVTENHFNGKVSIELQGIDIAL